MEDQTKTPVVMPPGPSFAFHLLNPKQDAQSTLIVHAQQANAETELEDGVNSTAALIGEQIQQCLTYLVNRCATAKDNVGFSDSLHSHVPTKLPEIEFGSYIELQNICSKTEMIVFVLPNGLRDVIFEVIGPARPRDFDQPERTAHKAVYETRLQTLCNLDIWLLLEDLESSKIEQVKLFADGITAQLRCVVRGLSALTDEEQRLIHGTQIWKPYQTLSEVCHVNLGESQAQHNAAHLVSHHKSLSANSMYSYGRGDSNTPRTHSASWSEGSMPWSVPRSIPRNVPKNTGVFEGYLNTTR